MSWSPSMERRRIGESGVEVRLGHPLLDDYLRFVAARCRTNTVLASGFDLLVFFTFTSKDPVQVTMGDVLDFIADQRAPRRGDNVVRLQDGEAGLEVSDGLCKGEVLPEGVTVTMTNEETTMSQEHSVDHAVEPEARKLRRELFDEALLDRLMDASDERGVALSGPGGFLPEMIKAVLERGMQAELAEHLGYDKGDPAGKGSGNSRNGTTPKTVGTEIGDVALDQPRDRNSSFASALVPKGARRLDE